MALIFSDDFNRANGAIESPWVNKNGAFNVTSNTAHPSVAGAYCVYGSDSYTDCEVVVEFITQEPGVVMRSNGGAQGYGATAYLIWWSASGSITINEVTAGSNNTIKTITGLTLGAGHPVKVRMVGTLISVYVDDVFKDSVTSSHRASGLVGLSGALNSNDALDNFSLYSIDASITSPVYAYAQQ